MTHKLMETSWGYLAMVLALVLANNVWAQKLSCSDPKYDSKAALYQGGKIAKRMPAWKTKREGEFVVDHKTAQVSMDGVSKSVNYKLYHSVVTPPKGTIVVLC